MSLAATRPKPSNTAQAHRRGNIRVEFLCSSLSRPGLTHNLPAIASGDKCGRVKDQHRQHNATRSISPSRVLSLQFDDKFWPQCAGTTAENTLYHTGLHPQSSGPQADQRPGCCAHVLDQRYLGSTSTGSARSIGRVCVFNMRWICVSVPSRQTSAWGRRAGISSVTMSLLSMGYPWSRDTVTGFRSFRAPSGTLPTCGLCCKGLCKNSNANHPAWSNPVEGIHHLAL